MAVKYEALTGWQTYIENASSGWSTAWDLPDETNLIMCMVTNFYAYVEYAPTYNSVAFTLLSTSNSNYPRQRLYKLENPPTDSDYTVGITWAGTYKYWCVRFVAFSGARNDGVSAITKVESTNWNGTQTSKGGDLVTLWSANKSDGNPWITWDSPGTERFSVRNDSSGNGEMQSGMATYPGLASTPIGTESGGDGSVEAHIMYNNIEQEAGGGRMILVMSDLWDKIKENRKKLGVGDLGNFKQGGNGLWKPQPELVTI